MQVETCVDETFCFSHGQKGSSLELTSWRLGFVTPELLNLGQFLNLSGPPWPQQSVLWRKHHCWLGLLLSDIGWDTGEESLRGFRGRRRGQMRKGFIQAKEFGFHPEGSEASTIVCEYILLFQILKNVVVDTQIRDPRSELSRAQGGRE